MLKLKDFSLRVIWLLALLALLGGCHTAPPAATNRPFNFQLDTFAYANELVWEYRFDDRGKWTSRPREPKPDYTHHCFVVARSARQFFEHARFDPAQPIADTKTYRRLIRRVVSLKPRRSLPESERIIIPGYANLREFSEAQTTLLREECGGAWQSYFQHGHWRMMLPFTRREQHEMAMRLLADLRANHPPVVHLVRFPQLTINHAIVVFDAAESENEIRFAAYDPNNPKTPVTLVFDRATRTFLYPTNDYFPGGRVDVYEVYRNLAN